MASSAQKLHHRHVLPTPHGTTTAPPPTPSNQPNLPSNSTTSDAIFNLLHRLPPTLSLSFPTRRSSSTSTFTTAPTISLSEPAPSLRPALLSAATELGFFHLTSHRISSELAVAAESAALSLLDLPQQQKEVLFNNDWPLGYDNEDEDGSESFCLDPSCSTVTAAEAPDLDLGPLHEFGREIEKIGLEMVQELASAVGFDDPTRVCSTMWISEGSDSPGRAYPYVLGLHYQTGCQKYSLWSDAGWVNVSGQVDSVLVTLGDIAQVWSNGKLKKVRGRPSMQNNGVTISLLITLPLETIVSPLSLILNEQRLFQSFPFEDYAWRMYHERGRHLPLKDPLLKYRILF